MTNLDRDLVREICRHYTANISMVSFPKTFLVNRKLNYTTIESFKQFKRVGIVLCSSSSKPIEMYFQREYGEDFSLFTLDNETLNGFFHLKSLGYLSVEYLKIHLPRKKQNYSGKVFTLFYDQGLKEIEIYEQCIYGDDSELFDEILQIFYTNSKTLEKAYGIPLSYFMKLKNDFNWKVISFSPTECEFRDLNRIAKPLAAQILKLCCPFIDNIFLGPYNENDPYMDPGRGEFGVDSHINVTCVETYLNNSRLYEYFANIAERKWVQTESINTNVKNFKLTLRTYNGQRVETNTIGKYILKAYARFPNLESFHFCTDHFIENFVNANIDKCWNNHIRAYEHFTGPVKHFLKDVTYTVVTKFDYTFVVQDYNSVPTDFLKKMEDFSKNYIFDTVSSEQLVELNNTRQASAYRKVKPLHRGYHGTGKNSIFRFFIREEETDDQIQFNYMQRHLDDAVDTSR